MKYHKTVEGKFISRPNRFIANVEVGGREHVVHVKNTGRCKELLLPGSKVILEQSDNPNRKTLYDLIAVYKTNYGGAMSKSLLERCHMNERFGLINIDSQAPNKVVYEWLLQQDFDYIKPEYTYGDSRIDFYMEKNGRRILMEVKGCTLERDGIGYFPDAPTARGVKHLRTLAKGIEDGYESILAYVIQMEGINQVHANIDVHKEYGEELELAKEKGLNVIFLPCYVEENELRVIPVEFK